MWPTKRATGTTPRLPHFLAGHAFWWRGKLSRRALVRGAAIMALAMLGVSCHLAWTHGRMAMLPAWGLAVGLLWLYSYPPVRAAYRGGGEIVQGLGVGVVLPLVGFYVQAGTVEGFPWPALLPCFLLGWASNVTTGPARPDRRRGSGQALLPGAGGRTGGAAPAACRSSPSESSCRPLSCRARRGRCS